MTEAGQGVGRSNGLAVFVKGAVVGDVVTAELAKVKKSYAFGRLLSVDEPSDDRIEAFCPYSGQCGGCAYGELSYEAQLALKEKQIRDKLIRLGGVAGLEQTLEGSGAPELNERFNGMSGSKEKLGSVGLPGSEEKLGSDGLPGSKVPAAAFAPVPQLRPIIGMGEPFRYRNKAAMPIWTGGVITRKGGVLENLGTPAIGFYQAKSHDVVDCYDCFLQSEPAMAAAEALRQFMISDNITAYDPKWEKGLLRHLVVKTARGTGEVMVILVINGKGIPNAEKLVDMLDDAIYNLPPTEDGIEYNLESVIINVNKAEGKAGKSSRAGGGKSGKAANENGSRSQRGTSIFGSECITLAGKPAIFEKVGGLQFEISPLSFYQVNPVQMEALYDKAMEYADLSGSETVLDLYCGVGTIGLFAAREMERNRNMTMDIGRVIGIESVKEAVLDANRNAVINNIVNARYICGKAEEELPKLISGEGLKDQSLKISHADVVFLDPPRAGCDERLLEAVIAIEPERIVYVSCDPATLARDVKYLTGKGYAFVEGTPVDMFPWTGSVETCVLLSHKNS